MVSQRSDVFFLTSWLTKSKDTINFNNNNDGEEDDDDDEEDDDDD